MSPLAARIDTPEPPTGRSETFRVDMLAVSVNRLMRSRKAVTQPPGNLRLLVRHATRNIRPFVEAVVITFTFYGARDADNYVKQTLDAIARAGLIVDDRYPYVWELRLRARPLGGARWPYTVVTIESAPREPQ